MFCLSSARNVCYDPSLDSPRCGDSSEDLASHRHNKLLADKRIRNDVVVASMRCNYVASTSVRRHFNVMCLLG